MSVIAWHRQPMNQIKSSLLKTVAGLIDPTITGEQTWKAGHYGELAGYETKLPDGSVLALVSNNGIGVRTGIYVDTWSSARARIGPPDVSQFTFGRRRTGRLYRAAARQVRARNRMSGLRAVRTIGSGDQLGN